MWWGGSVVTLGGAIQFWNGGLRFACRDVRVGGCVWGGGDGSGALGPRGQVEEGCSQLVDDCAKAGAGYGWKGILRWDPFLPSMHSPREAREERQLLAVADCVRGAEPRVL